MTLDKGPFHVFARKKSLTKANEKASDVINNIDFSSFAFVKHFSRKDAKKTFS